MIRLLIPAKLVEEGGKKMKKTFYLLLTVCLIVCSVAGCKAKQDKPKSSVTTVKFDDFIDEDRNNESTDDELLGDFDLRDYLLSYGAIDICRIYSGAGDAHIAAEFENKIVVDFYFRKDWKSQREYATLSEIHIFCVNDNYNLDNLWEGDYSGITSLWSRMISAEDTDNFVSEQYNGRDDRYYMVNMDDLFFVGEDEEKYPVAVQETFDDGFKTSVAPYIEVNNPSFRGDPVRKS